MPENIYARPRSSGNIYARPEGDGNIYASGARAAGAGGGTTATDLAEAEARAKSAGIAGYAPGLVGFAQRVLAHPLTQTAVDVISRPNYAVAGAVEEILPSPHDPGRQFAAAKRAARELLSGVGPIQGEKRAFGEVMERAGIGAGPSLSDLLPEGIPGRTLVPYSETGEELPLQRGGIFDPTVRGTAGLILDIAADPLTYVTGGVGKGLQLTTKEGVKTLSRAGMRAARVAGEEIAGRAVMRGAEDVAVSALPAAGREIAERVARREATRAVEEAFVPRGTSGASLEARKAAQENIRAAVAESSTALDDLIDREASVLLSRGFKKSDPIYRAFTRAVTDEAKERVLVAAQTAPHLLDRGGIKFAGLTMPGTPALAVKGSQVSAGVIEALGAIGKQAGQVAGRAPLVGPYVLKAVENTPKVYDAVGRLFDRDWIGRNFPYYIALKQAYLDGVVAMEGKILGQVDGSESMRWLRRRLMGRDEINRKIVKAAERGNLSTLSANERAVATELRQIMDDMGLVEYGDNLLDDTRPNYVAHFYDNSEAELRRIFGGGGPIQVWRGKKIDKGSLGRHNEVRAFDTLEEAEEFARAVKAKDPKAPTLKPIWDPVEIIARRAHAHANAVGYNGFVATIAKEIGDDLPFDAETVFELTRPPMGAAGLNAHQAREYEEIGKWFKRTQGPEVPDDLVAAREAVAAERKALTPRRTLEAELKEVEAPLSAHRITQLRERASRLRDAIPAPTTRGKYIPADEIRYYERRGWTVHRMENGRYRAMLGPEANAGEIARRTAAADAAKRELDAAIARHIGETTRRKVRASEIRSDLGRWGFVDQVESEIASGHYGITAARQKRDALRFVRGLSQEGREEFFRQQLLRVKDRDELVNVFGKYHEFVDDFPRQRGYGGFFDADGKPLAEVNIGQLAGVRIPQEIADSLADLSVRTLDSPEVNMLVRGWDAINNTFKTWVTVLFPSFHFRNVAMSNVANSFLDLGFSAFDPRMLRHSAAILTGEAGEFATRQGARYSYDEIRELARQHNIYQTGAGFAELTGKRPLMERGPGAVARKVGATFESEARLRLFLSHLRRGSDPMQAAARVKSALFDYQNLSRFEKDFLKRGIPFVTFQRKNLPYQLRKLRETPGRQAAIVKPFRGRESEDREMTSWEAEGFKLRLNRDGKTLKVMNGIDLPIRSLDNLWRGSLDRTAATWVGQLSPFIKPLFEIPAGKNLFTGREFTRQESATAGRVIEHIAPQVVKDFLGYEKKVDAAGRPTYTFDGQKFYILVQSWVLSRLVSTSDRQFRSIAESPQSARVLLDVLTGLRYKEMDLDAEQKRMIDERFRYLQKRLAQEPESEGGTRRFERYYAPGGGARPPQ